MENRVRNQLLSGLFVLIVGVVLLVTVSMAAPPKMIHTGYVVLTNQEELDKFSSAVILNQIESTDYTIYGDKFPYIVHLETTPTASEFNYGQAHQASIWRLQELNAFGMGTVIWWGIGLIITIVGLIYLLPTLFIPKLVTHRLLWGFQFVPDGFDAAKFRERTTIAYDETLKEIKPQP